MFVYVCCLLYAVRTWLAFFLSRSLVFRRNHLRAKSFAPISLRVLYKNAKTHTFCGKVVRSLCTPSILTKLFRKSMSVGLLLPLLVCMYMNSSFVHHSSNNEERRRPRCLATSINMVESHCKQLTYMLVFVLA